MDTQKRCKKGYRKDKNGECINIESLTKTKRQRCKNGERRNKNGDCVAIRNLGEFVIEPIKLDSPKIESIKLDSPKIESIKPDNELKKRQRCKNGERRNKNGDCVAIRNLREFIIDPIKKESHNIESVKPDIDLKKTKKTCKKDECVKNNLQEKKNITKKLKHNKMKAISIMNEFKEKGIVVIETLSKDDLTSVIREANKQYHSLIDSNDKPLLTDAEYDIIREFIEKKYPNSEILNEVGAEVNEKQKVTLPVNMPSMDKIKPDTNALENWKQKYNGPYLLSCKLDGVSGLYYSMESQKKLYTRGNGTIGQDISYLLKKLNIPVMENVIVRGEFIIKKSVFESKHKNDFANIRNMVAGIVNRKKLDNKIESVDFVAYEVISPILKPSEQMKFLETNGFNTVKNSFYTSIDNSLLSNKLVDWRKNYEYEIDGVIVSDDNIHKRISGNPDHSFAFKMVISDQVAETHVTDVIWSASKDGYLKPRVRINPVHIGGVKIEYATGFNGQFIERNKIGIGAIVQIVRSGDVIPYIKSVTTPAEEPKMPDEKYSWTSTHVDIMLVNKDDDITVLEKQITLFFTTLDVAGLSSGNVKRLIEGGYNTISKILKLEKEDFLKIEGFKQKLAEKIYSGIKLKVEEASLSKLMVASGKMGRGLGEKKIKPILQQYPNILVSGETENEKIQMLLNIEGIGKENAKTFINNIPKFVQFLVECDLKSKLDQKAVNIETETLEKQNKDHILFEKKILITGFRDKELMKRLEEEFKVTFSSTISKDVFIVLVKNENEENAKIKKAKELSIPIVKLTDFISKFMNE